MDIWTDYIVLCDFDGTISETSLSDFLYRKFASCGMMYSELWAEDRIGTIEEIENSFKCISASKEEMENALASVRLVSGFLDFYNFCHSNSLDLIIVSDGLEWAIRFVLERSDVRDIGIMSNQIYFRPDGFRFKFPYFDPEYPKIGVRKLNIVNRFKLQEKKVILIGDGKTDIEAAQAADYVFANNSLIDFCRNKNVPFFPFKNFHDILGTLEAGHFSVHE